MCFLNAGYLFIPMLVGIIHDATVDDEYFGYLWVGVFYLFMIFGSGVFLTIIVYISSTRFDNILNGNHSKDEEEKVDQIELI